MAAVNPDADSREVILASAERLMARKGIRDSSLAEIAKAAGISRGTLYYHYRSKEELILDIAEGHMKALTGKFVALAESRADMALSALLERLFSEILADDTRSSLHLHIMHEVFEGSEAIRKRMDSSYGEWLSLSEAQLRRLGVAPRDLKDVSRLVIAAIDGLILQKKVSSRPEGVQERRIARILAEGIGLRALAGKGRNQTGSHNV